MSLIRSDICEPKTEMMKGEIELSRRSEETTFPGMGTSTNKNNLIGPTFTFWQQYEYCVEIIINVTELMLVYQCDQFWQFLKVINDNTLVFDQMFL